jgi:hypothetical protein
MDSILKISNKNYKNMINDIAKALTLIFTVETIAFITNKKENAFNQEIVQLTIFIITGIIIYWTFVEKIINKTSNLKK